MSNLKISTTVVLSIIATGALLNAGSKGYMGNTVKDLSDFIISGYGA